MGQRVGMDPKRVADAAVRIRASLDELTAASDATDSAAQQSLNPLGWGIYPGGLILAPASIAATQWAAASVRTATADAQKLLGELLVHLAEQERASSDLQGSGAAKGLGSRTALQQARAVIANAETDDAAVAAAWLSLTTAERAQLIAEYPLLIGNRAGIPFVDRIDANRVTAELRLERNDLTRSERRYLEEVTTGGRALVTYDPDNDRIVEVLGTLGPETERVITYVPGTGASLGGFYDGSTEPVAKYLVEQDRASHTAAFVYKDGPWANWDPRSENGNSNPAFAETRGAEIAEFESLIDREMAGGDALRIGIAHSAGFSALTGSEVAGAGYDHVVSLAGSWIADGWSPQPNTAYAHYQYGNDAINLLNATHDTPAESSTFRQVRLPPEVAFSWGDRHFQDPIANHIRIAEGPETNQEALLDLRNRLIP